MKYKEFLKNRWKYNNWEYIFHITLEYCFWEYKHELDDVINWIWDKITKENKDVEVDIYKLI